MDVIRINIIDTIHSQSMLITPMHTHTLTASLSLGNMLEMKIIRLHPRPAESWLGATIRYDK